MMKPSVTVNRHNQEAYLWVGGEQVVLSKTELQQVLDDLNKPVETTHTFTVVLTADEQFALRAWARAYIVVPHRDSTVRAVGKLANAVGKCFL